MSRQPYLLYVLLLTLTIAACNSRNIRFRANSLEAAINGYSVAWRWSLYNDIEDFHRDRDGGQVQLDTGKLQAVRVTGYRVDEKVVNESVSEATIRGEIEYYNTSRGTLQKISFEHQWWYDPELKAWFNAGEIPRFE